MVEQTSRQASVVITPHEAGLRLDMWLADRFTYRSRRQWQACVRRGEIQLNGRAAKPANILQTGDHVLYDIPEAAEPEVDDHIDILFDDDDVQVLAKSGNLPCHPGGRYFRHTLWQVLRESLPDVHVVNRLDRETSGVVLVAKNAATAGAIAAQFSNHSVTKTYLVLVHGEFPEALSAAGSLASDAGSSVRKKRLFREACTDGEWAETEFVRLASAGGVSLVQAIPATGRLHQIRATLCSLGFPVVGDKLYGLDDQFYLAFIEDALTEGDRAALQMHRQALHAYSLGWRHPVTAQQMSTVAPVPDDMQRLIDRHGLDLPETVS